MSEHGHRTFRNGHSFCVLSVSPSNVTALVMKIIMNMNISQSKNKNTGASSPYFSKTSPSSYQKPVLKSPVTGQIIQLFYEQTFILELVFKQGDCYRILQVILREEYV